MTANHAHTRALEENIKAYRATIQEFWHLKSQGMADTEEIGRGFDNFIAHVRAAAEQRGAARGWDRGFYESKNHDHAWEEDPPNPYRADQITDKEGDDA